MPFRNPSGGGAQQIPRVWDPTANTFLRWDYTQQAIGSGSGNAALAGATFASTGSDTLALTKQGGGSGNGVFPATKMAGNAGYYIGVGGNPRGWQGGAGGGHTLPAGSSATLISLFRHMQQPSAGFPGVYVEKCYYLADGNVPPYISLGLHFQPAGTHNWTAYISTGGALTGLLVPFPFDMLQTPAVGDLQRGDVIMLFSRYTQATGLFEGGVNGRVFASTNLGAGVNIDWGTDGDWLVGTSFARNGQDSVPWDENLCVELCNAAIPDATLRQWWEIANFGASV